MVLKLHYRRVTEPPQERHRHRVPAEMVVPPYAETVVMISQKPLLIYNNVALPIIGIIAYVVLVHKSLKSHSSKNATNLRMEPAKTSSKKFPSYRNICVAED